MQKNINLTIEYLGFVIFKLPGEMIVESIQLTIFTMDNQLNCEFIQNVVFPTVIRFYQKHQSMRNPKALRMVERWSNTCLVVDNPFS